MPPHARCRDECSRARGAVCRHRHRAGNGSGDVGHLVVTSKAAGHVPDPGRDGSQPTAVRCWRRPRVPEPRLVQGARSGPALPRLSLAFGRRTASGTPHDRGGKPAGVSKPLVRCIRSVRGPGSARRRISRRHRGCGTEVAAPKLWHRRRATNDTSPNEGLNRILLVRPSRSMTLSGTRMTIQPVVLPSALSTYEEEASGAREASRRGHIGRPIDAAS